MTWKSCILLCLSTVLGSMCIVHCLKTMVGYYNEIDSIIQQHRQDSVRIHYLEGQVDLLNVYKEKLP